MPMFAAWGFRRKTIGGLLAALWVCLAWPLSLQASQPAFDELMGEYRGHYVCGKGQGKTGARLHVRRIVGDGEYMAFFEFFRLPGSGNIVKPGSYELWITRTPNGNGFRFVPSQWISRPAGFVAAGFDLYPFRDGAGLQGTMNFEACGQMVFSKVKGAPAQPERPERPDPEPPPAEQAEKPPEPEPPRSPQALSEVVAPRIDGDAQGSAPREGEGFALERWTFNDALGDFVTIAEVAGISGSDDVLGLRASCFEDGAVSLSMASPRIERLKGSVSNWTLTVYRDESAHRSGDVLGLLPMRPDAESGSGLTMRSAADARALLRLAQDSAGPFVLELPEGDAFTVTGQGAAVAIRRAMAGCE